MPIRLHPPNLFTQQMTAVHIKMLEEHIATMIPFVMVFPYALMFYR